MNGLLYALCRRKFYPCLKGCETCVSSLLLAAAMQSYQYVHLSAESVQGWKNYTSQAVQLLDLNRNILDSYVLVSEGCQYCTYCLDGVCCGLLSNSPVMH